MERRRALTLIGLGVAGALSFLTFKVFGRGEVREFGKTILHRLKPDFRFPAEGTSISVEKALNSRCTSDNDGNSRNFHWGKFDSSKKLSSEQIKNLISLARIPRFTDQEVRIQTPNNILTFTALKNVSGMLKDGAMIESGMQQQAVCLVCAALGVGMVFSNLGKDGRWVSETEYAAIRIKLGAMMPAYNGRFWTSSPPTGTAGWLKGNLSDPVRDGGKALIQTLAGLKLENKGSAPMTRDTIGQLLWAGRGRTTHFYNSKPWGMTIPTWAGKQNISSLYLVSENTLFRYVNWNENRPTHSLLQLNAIAPGEFRVILESFSAAHALIVIGKNEFSARALWEVGYQLMNMLLQASSLDISYAAFLLNEREKGNLAKIGIVDPVATLAV